MIYCTGGCQEGYKVNQPDGMPENLSILDVSRSSTYRLSLSSVKRYFPSGENISDSNIFPVGIWVRLVPSLFPMTIVRDRSFHNSKEVRKAIFFRSDDQIKF